MWDVIPWVLLACGLGLIGWMIWLKFNGREIPTWMKWVSYAVNAFAMLALALRSRKPAPRPEDDEPVVPIADPGTPHVDEAEDIVEDVISESTEAGRRERDEDDDTAASTFTSGFGSNIGAPEPPSE